MKYRIFISSVQGEFTAERRNLKDWLTSDAVLSRFVESVFIFEDVPSRGVGKARGRYFVLRTNTDTNGTNRTHGSVREKFVCRGSVVDAHGSTGPGSPFVVLRGSVVSSGMMPSLKSRTPSYYKLRCGLEKDGTIVNGVFTRDFEFASPSAASSVVTGRPSNGRLDWMTTDGRSLKVVQEEWRT